MDNLIDKKMHELHQVTPDIDDFLDEAVNILRESSITYEVFCEWYESIPATVFQMISLEFMMIGTFILINRY